uniref:Uncharacterized protein n=1 Tax=viral metagenome TaxID=1070528 RepID=A0A6M3LXG1_9ZZZZ
MEGSCQRRAVDLFYIYNNAHVLGKVWNGIDAERRQESIDRLRTKVADLNDRKEVRREDANRMFGTLDRAEKLNKTRQPTGSIYSACMGVIPDPIILSQLRNFLTDNALELAIHGIADCERMKPITEEKTI